MRHLIDQRAPVTTEDIDQAIADAHWWLDDEATEPCSGNWSVDDLTAAEAWQAMVTAAEALRAATSAEARMSADDRVEDAWRAWLAAEARALQAPAAAEARALGQLRQVEDVANEQGR
jgi:hypothetical protein